MSKFKVVLHVTEQDETMTKSLINFMIEQMEAEYPMRLISIEEIEYSEL